MEKINKEQALTELKTIKDRVKVLEDIINSEETPKNIIERVKTFEDACSVLGIDSKSEKFYIGTSDEIAYKKLKVIAEALREGVKLDWFDTNQYKHYCYFNTSNNAFVFDLAVYDYYISVVPSALCVDTNEKAEYFAKQFIDLFRDYLIS